MKKFTFFFGMALLGMSTANAQDPVIANPTLEDGSYIVKYDMENHKFAESNDFEIDETFVFAIDVTGTPYVDKLAETGRNPAVIGRGMARDIYANNDINKFPHFEAGGNLDGRMFHIEGNVYGMCFNIFQYASGLYKDGPLGYVSATEYDCCQPGAVTTFGCNVFPFGYSADNQGIEWWDAIATPITTVWFNTAPYTGTKTSPDFYFDDYTTGEAFPGCADSKNSDKGWCKPEFYKNVTSGINDVIIDNNDNAPVEYYNLQGVLVNNPENGMYIRRQGTKATKIVLK